MSCQENSPRPYFAISHLNTDVMFVRATDIVIPSIIGIDSVPDIRFSRCKFGRKKEHMFPILVYQGCQVTTIEIVVCHLGRPTGRGEPPLRYLQVHTIHPHFGTAVALAIETRRTIGGRRPWRLKPRAGKCRKSACADWELWAKSSDEFAITFPYMPAESSRDNSANSIFTAPRFTSAWPLRSRSLVGQSAWLSPAHKAREGYKKRQ